MARIIPTNPYLINLTNEKLIFCCFIKLINIIPASDPSGVNKAHRFDAAITSYIVFVLTIDDENISEYKILIGILFNKFPNKKLLTPYKNGEFAFSNICDKSLIKSVFARQLIRITIDIKKGTNDIGKSCKLVNMIFVLIFFTIL